MWNPFKKKMLSAELYQSNFFLAFKFIPMVVGLYNDRKLEEHFLSQVKSWKVFIKDRLNTGMRFDWTHTNVTAIETNCDSDCFFVLMSFARPYAIAAAKAGLIVGSRKNHHARYFTLECSMGGNMVCECTTERHSNLGIKLPDSNDLSSFIVTVLKTTNINTKIVKL